MASLGAISLKIQEHRGIGWDAGCIKNETMSAASGYAIRIRSRRETP